MNPIAQWLGQGLTAYLGRERPASYTAAPVDLRQLQACLKPADVLLVEGNTRISTAIKYLTQSSWSHAALYVGPMPGRSDSLGQSLCFVEADLAEGVRAVPASQFEGLNVRVCRPVGLTADDVHSVITYGVERIGYHYDLRNVIDLMRYLLPTPPVPTRWRRRLLALGSGDPTRAICSTLIAQAFQSVRYPILPTIEERPANDPKCTACVEEILSLRHHSLFVPRDFDVSPYFEVIKPTLAAGFEYRTLQWHEKASESMVSPGQV